eukprot:194384-Hanusia_phi.AAC.1
MAEKEEIKKIKLKSDSSHIRRIVRSYHSTTSLDNIRLLLSLAAGNGYERGACHSHGVFMIPPEIMQLPRGSLLNLA